MDVNVRLDYETLEMLEKEKDWYEPEDEEYNTIMELADFYAVYCKHQILMETMQDFKEFLIMIDKNYNLYVSHIDFGGDFDNEITIVLSRG